MVVKRLLIVALALPWLACRGADPMPSSLPSTGLVQLSSPATVEGNDLNLVGAFYAVGLDRAGDPVLLIWLSSSLDACKQLGSGAQIGGSSLLTMRLQLVSANGALVVPQPGRTYRVVNETTYREASGATLSDGSDAFAQVAAVVLDSACLQSLSETGSVATAGSLALLSWEGANTPLRAALDASLAVSDDSFSLQFTATYCAALSSVAMTPPSQCVSSDS